MCYVMGEGKGVVFVHRGAGSTIACRFVGATSTSAGRGDVRLYFMSPLPQGFKWPYLSAITSHQARDAASPQPTLRKKKEARIDLKLSSRLNFLHTTRTTFPTLTQRPGAMICYVMGEGKRVDFVHRGEGSTKGCRLLALYICFGV